MMLEYGLRFLAGGIAVSAFAALGDTLRPKSFAGLFGAAPSIALATLLITLSHKGAPFAAVEGRSMIVGAFALAAYNGSFGMTVRQSRGDRQDPVHPWRRPRTFGRKNPLHVHAQMDAALGQGKRQ